MTGDYKAAFEQVLPLLEYIAEWESKNGSSACVLECEYKVFMRGYKQAMFISSPRGALSSLGIKYDI